MLVLLPNPYDVHVHALVHVHVHVQQTISDRSVFVLDADDVHVDLVRVAVVWCLYYHQLAYYEPKSQKFQQNIR